MSNAFLWTGSPNQHHKTKVAWEDVCQPTSEGGLGIRKLIDTSRVFSYKLIWNLLSNSNSLLVNWVQRHLIRHHSFRNVPSTTLGSWVWRKLLKLRDSVSGFFKGVVADGETLPFWFDNWHPQGPLIQQLGSEGPRILGVYKVAEATDSNGWRIRSRTRRHADIINNIRQIQPPRSGDGSDSYLWRHGEDDFKALFSATRTWDQIRIKHPQVLWAKLIWFSQSIPRCRFITWLALRNRLSTGDRMRAWGIIQPCVLCGERNESTRRAITSSLPALSPLRFGQRWEAPF